jgi:hypothetical protein
MTNKPPPPPLEETLAQLNEACKEARKGMTIFDYLREDLFVASQQTRKKLPKVKPKETRLAWIRKNWIDF